LKPLTLLIFSGVVEIAWAIICVMEISQAQRDVRITFVGGCPGTLASSLVWFASAIVATWVSFRAGAITLVACGFFIYPLMLLMLRLMGKPSGLPKGHPMNALGMQVAFVLPLMIPLVYAATLYRHSLFYPMWMIATGAHYLPFMFSYGMKHFGVLAAVLIGLGYCLARYDPSLISGAWLGAGVLLVFAFVGLWALRMEERKLVG
jgi:hypothetical protein